jgi:chitinase
VTPKETSDRIVMLFWHNFISSESAFVMRDVIRIALEDAENRHQKTSLPMKRSRDLTKWEM